MDTRGCYWRRGDALGAAHVFCVNDLLEGVQQGHWKAGSHPRTANPQRHGLIFLSVLKCHLKQLLTHLHDSCPNQKPSEFDELFH